MKNQQQEFESRKAAVAKLIEEQLKEGSLGTTLRILPTISMTARRNPHNWLIKLHPARVLQAPI